MPATDQEHDERWQLALDGLKDANQSYHTLTRIVQNGFGTIGERLDGNSKRIATLEGEVKAVRATETECQRELAALKVDGQARAHMMRLLIAFVLALLVFSIVQTSLWWYVVARLFNV